VASAQVSGTDCGCTEAGAYVEPDAGVPPDGGAVSPGGAFRVEGGALPGPISVKPTGSDDPLLQVQASDWGWSPDGDRIVILSETGSPPNTSRQYFLYDLSGGPTTTPLWTSPLSAQWTSERIRFSEDGAVLLFAALSGGDDVELQAFEIATGATLTDSFSFFSPPSNFDDDSDPEVAGWGFGPDPTRIAYGYTTGQGSYTRVLGNVATGVRRGIPYTAIAEVPFFSPCGDVFAEKVQQLVTSGDVTVTLYSTANPQAAALGSQGFPNGLEVEVRANADDHVGLLGGDETAIADNTAGTACSATNQPPLASFAPPAEPLAGEAATFTDTSSDPDGSIVAWSWDFGDGATSSAHSPAHTYADAGRYTVRLTVTDDDGATASTQLPIRVCGTLATPPGKLLFTRPTSPMGYFDAWAIDTDSQSVARITNSSVSASGLSYFGARWSPDGSRIAFAVSSTGVTEGDGGIYVMNADGSGRRQVTDAESLALYDRHLLPIWTPDAAWIVFKDNELPEFGGDPGIYFVRPDGSGLAKVPGTTRYDTAYDMHPALAEGCETLAPAARGPSCYTLLTTYDPRDYTSEIWKLGTIREMPGDGSSQRTLVPTPGIYGWPRYAPGGSQISYEFLGQGASNDGRMLQIATLDLATPGAAPEVVVADSAGADAEHPVWSPDGTAIAYTKVIYGGIDFITERDVYVTDSLGCNETRLVGQPDLFEWGHDWVSGSVTQALGSISGIARLHTSHDVHVPTQPLAGVVVELSGDATGTATTGADGTFTFSNLPIGGTFTVRIVSAPDAVNTTSARLFPGFLGSAANVYFRIVPDQVRLSGRVLESYTGIAGATVIVEGPGGPYQATTGPDGGFAFDVPFRAQFHVRAEAPGYRIEPRDLFTSDEFSIPAFDLQAYALPPPGRVAFTSHRDGNDEIYAVDLDGRNLVNLTNDPAADVEPAISPDGTRIAFASDRSGAFELFLMDAGGFEVTPLGVEGREPAWSPDGASLAFASANGLRSLDLASGAVAPLTSDPSDASPRFDANGRAVIGFERELAPDDWAWMELDLAAPAGAQESVAGSFPGFDGDPAYQPGGDARAYVTDEGALAYRYVRIEIPSTFAFYGLYVGENPSWSPDGERVVADDGNGNLWWTEKDAAGIQRWLTQAGVDRDPDWGPPYVPACDNGLDDDGDGLADLTDPGCFEALDGSERGIDWFCDDGLDQDGDGLADFPADPGCEDPYDPDETRFDHVCDNGLDDDADGVADFPADPGCRDPLGTDEVSECQDGSDNDGDGLTDTDDPTCGGEPTAPTEFAACQNGIDDDRDGAADLFDAGCDDPNDTSERGPAHVCDDGDDQDGDAFADFPDDPGCTSPFDVDETDGRFECDNGFDDDGDGLVDVNDPGCPFPNASPENPQCDNGFDDDGNGFADFDDPKCTREWPYWENPPACGLGGELLLLVAAWRRLRRRAGTPSGSASRPA